MCSGEWGGAARERRLVAGLEAVGLAAVGLEAVGLGAGREVSRAGAVDSCWRFRGGCGR